MRRFVIVGGDAAAWLGALTLQAAGAGDVTVVELPGRLREADIYPSLPALAAFHRRLGIDEARLLRAVRGACTLGQDFHNFSGGGSRFFHAYGPTGAPIRQTAFAPFYIRARKLGLSVAWEDFNLTAAAARQDRLLTPGESGDGFADAGYGYHLPAAAYVAALREQAIRGGAKVVAARETGAEIGADGAIAAVTTQAGQRVAGDLFIDASGPDGALLRGALGTPFRSWRRWFAADRMMAASAPRLPRLPPYAQVRALTNGWLAMYAAQDRTRLLYVYEGRLSRDDEALQAMRVVSNLRLEDAVLSTLEPGRAEAAWVKNCVAIGEAACVFDPIDSPALHAVQSGLAHLAALLPQGLAGAAAYNAAMTATFDRIRDFQLVHSLCNRHHGGAFWNAARQAEAPEELARRLEGFARDGTLDRAPYETFSPDSWRTLLLGHGVTPRAYAPDADSLSDAELAVELSHMLSRIRRKVEPLASHDAWLEMFCEA